MSSRRLLPFFLLLVLSLTFMTYQSNKGTIAPFRFFSDPLNRLNGMIHSLFVSIKEPFRKITLRDEENRRLREEILKLRMEQQRYREVFYENQRLREITSLKERERRYVTTARIISRGLDPWSNVVVIEKGRRDGVFKDMAAITPLGLVGKVSAEGDNYSQVLFVTDISFSAAVKLQETRKEAILSGTGSAHCILKYVPDEDSIKQGDIVITSGFDDLFPQELVVGYVSKVDKKGASIFQRVEVMPSQDLTRLDEVIIVRR
ncbi:MAG TPA: rod shape-determining protein MreC [Thermodesulfovibrionales bacterium]|nr:rod shape-determining protein MreC [Thermodesulfovibrionales bacterium]